MRDTRGYILFEALVSMGLLSICMIAIYQAMRDSAAARGLAEDYTTARFLLEQVALEQELQYQVMEGAGEGIFPEPNQRFAYSWQISKVEVPTEALPRMMNEEQRAQMEQQVQKFLGKLAVTIRWSRAGLDHATTGETLLRPGLLWLPPEVVQ